VVSPPPVRVPAVRNGRANPGLADRAGRIASAVLVVGLVLVAVTGVVLLFAYRPGSSSQRGPIGLPSGGGTLAGAVRVVHFVAAIVSTSASLVAALAALRGVFRRVHSGRTIATWIGIVCAGILAALTGYILPWDRLLLSLRAQGNPHGYLWLLGDDVLLALTRNSAVSPADLLGWLVAHVVLGFAASSLLIVALRARRRRA
jgi:hypothetical protein